MIPWRRSIRQRRLLQAPFAADLGNLASVHDAKLLEEPFLFFERTARLVTQSLWITGHLVPQLVIIVRGTQQTFLLFKAVSRSGCDPIGAFPWPHEFGCIFRQAFQGRAHINKSIRKLLRRAPGAPSSEQRISTNYNNIQWFLRRTAMGFPEIQTYQTLSIVVV